ncbi:uncharacterized protein G2W53_019351 [Senna tora]|uniref:Uncharacterized protein n=1 Tax=Senna tora TaxID=362788 RepID=A0A834WM94_9FABA|nr:uncharacterized protein G2W53_019351 [Senna tora]
MHLLLIFFNSPGKLITEFIPHRLDCSMQSVLFLTLSNQFIFCNLLHQLINLVSICLPISMHLFDSDTCMVAVHDYLFQLLDDAALEKLQPASSNCSHWLADGKYRNISCGTKYSDYMSQISGIVNLKYKNQSTRIKKSRDRRERERKKACLIRGTRRGISQKSGKVRWKVVLVKIVVMVVVVAAAAKSRIGRGGIIGRAMHSEEREVVMEVPESSGELPSRESGGRRRRRRREMVMVNDGMV